MSSSLIGVARANDDVPDPHDPTPWLAIDHAPQWEGGVAFDLGTFHTGDITSFAIGFDATAGVRLDRLALVGEYRLLSLGPFPPPSSSDRSVEPVALDSEPAGATDTPSGIVQRFGVDARYSVWKAVSAVTDDVFRTDLWIEATAGEEVVRWNSGGVLHRPDLGLGIGWSVGGRDAGRHGAYFVALRATIARSPRSVQPAITCAGPCDAPTGPLDLDKSVLFTTGALFGG